MKPIDYIYKNLHCFNLAIFKQILAESGEEVSESIYDYLMETTWNTNPTFLKQFGLDIVRTKEESGTDGARYVIKLAKYGTGMEIYAEDSPWKPTREELGEVMAPLYTEVNKKIQEGENEIDAIRFMSSEIKQLIVVYNKDNVEMTFAGDCWVNRTFDQIIENGDIRIEGAEYLLAGAEFQYTNNYEEE